jgi:hypothetical protein
LFYPAMLSSRQSQRTTIPEHGLAWKERFALEGDPGKHRITARVRQ